MAQRAASTIAALPHKFNWWYEGIIDWMLANPDKSLGDCAKHFNVTLAWLSMIRSTDMFKERFAVRREQFNQMLHADLADKMTRVASSGLDIIQKELDNQETKKIPLQTVVDLTMSTLTKLGYGVPKAPQSGAVINILEVGASPDAIKKARDYIRSEQFERARVEATDHQGGDEALGGPDPAAPRVPEEVEGVDDGFFEPELDIPDSLPDPEPEDESNLDLLAQLAEETRL